MHINIVRLDALKLERRAAHVSRYQALLAQGVERSSRGEPDGIQVWVRSVARVTRLKLDWREQAALVGLWGSMTST